MLAYIGMLAVSFAGVFAWISGSSFVLQDIYGLSALSFGLAFAAASGGYLAGTALATRIVLRLGLDRTIGIGAVALAAGGLGAVAAIPLGGPSPIPLIAAMALYAVGMGLVQPQTMAGAMMPFPQRAGTASSLLGVSQMVCAAVSGVIVGHSRHERLAGRDPARAGRDASRCCCGSFRAACGRGKRTASGGSDYPE